MKGKIRALLVMSRERRPSILEQLDACGVEVLPACDLSEAVRILGTQPVDVVVTGTSLPDGDWSRVLDCLAESGLQPQVVVCAGRVDKSLCAEMFRRGAYDLLVEPYSREEMLRVLEAAAAKTYMSSLRGGGGSLTAGNAG